MATNAFPDDWRETLVAAAGARRVMVIGATDTGKSHFVGQVLAGDGGRMLIDLDPGQKMIGAPGTLGLGALGEDGQLALERFAFTGSTSPLPVRTFLAATRSLIARDRRRMIANTSGLVDGVGIQLQRETIKAVRPDLIVAIADGPELAPILEGLTGAMVVRVRPSPDARRKGHGERRRARQHAFAAALDGAVRQRLSADVDFRPAAPAAFAADARPVCALADARGRPFCIGVVEAVGAEAITVFAPTRPEPAAAILVGQMWAAPAGASWRLLDRLEPGWGARLRAPDAAANTPDLKGEGAG